MTSSPERFGVIGYGHFGRALVELCQGAGLEVRAFDPYATVPAELAAPSQHALAEWATLIVVAVPLDQMRATFEALAPVVRPDQVVVDVGSVKVAPVQAMTELFGARVPWVATHPLFGPASLARGERPLRVVVCPNALHPAPVERVKASLTTLGCVFIDRAPEAHDQEMALTHALAFYVAKGMLDAGVPSDAPIAPPSFQGMARSIEAVRVDAGHLFGALHRFNPFAPAARKRLLEALSTADRVLSESEAGKSSPIAPALQIPDMGAASPELLETRELIDEVDQEILALLARRAELAKRAGRAKAARGLGVTDPGREVRLLEARRKMAAALGLSGEAVDEIFQAILRFSRGVQH